MTTPDPSATPAPRKPEPEQAAAFIRAVSEGDRTAVGAFITEFPVFIDVPDVSTGYPALSVATIKGQKDVFNALLSAGAEVGKTDNFGWTALHHAVWHNRLDLIPLLLEKGARVDSRTGKGKTALMLAASQGYVEAAAALLEAGAKIDEIDYNGNTIMGVALQVQPEMKQLLDEWPQIQQRRAEEKAEAERLARRQAEEKAAEKSSGAVIDKLKSAPPRKNPFKRGGP